MKRVILIGVLCVLAGCDGPTTEPTGIQKPHQDPNVANVAPNPQAAPAPSAGAPPAAPPEQKHTAWMVIVGGSKVKAEAKAMLEEVKGEQLPGQLVLVDSSTVDGLNPGFFIISAGVIKDQSVAERVRKHFNRFRKGTYVREVQVEESEQLTCPAPRCPGPWRAVVIHSVAESPGEDWGFFTNDVQDALDGHDIIFPNESSGATTVRIERGGHLLGTVDVSRYRTNGYILVSDNRAPSFVPHAMPGDVISEIDGYFDLGMVVH